MHPVHPLTLVMETTLPIETSRLMLIPMNYDLIRNLIDKKDALLMGQHICIDSGWPSTELYLILEDFINELNPLLKPNGFMGWIITDKVSFKALGDIGFNGPPDSSGVVEIGYNVVDRAQGVGYCSEAVSALVTWAKERPDIQWIQAECLVDNIPSAKVLRKNGFKVQYQENMLMHWSLKCK